MVVTAQGLRAWHEPSIQVRLTTRSSNDAGLRRLAGRHPGLQLGCCCYWGVAIPAQNSGAGGPAGREACSHRGSPGELMATNVLQPSALPVYDYDA